MTYTEINEQVRAHYAKVQSMLNDGSSIEDFIVENGKLINLLSELGRALEGEQ
jgi:hypothetical protein